MILKIYSIYDRLSGIYSEPFTAVNEDVAKRRFKQICLSSSVVAPDLQLFLLGSYDSSQGLILLNQNLKPEYIEGGVANG